MPSPIPDDRTGSSYPVAELLAEVSSHVGKAPRWSELRLWRTPGGLYCVEKVGRSEVRGEVDRRSAWTCGDLASVERTLGRGPLSLELLDKVLA